MNFIELAASLPNGLHDAELLRIAANWIDRTAQLELEVWVAIEGSPDELYRRAVVTLTGLHFLAIEPPDSTYPYREQGPVTIDVTQPEIPLFPTLAGESSFRIFVNEWNAFISGSADGAHLEWVGLARTRDG